MKKWQKLMQNSETSAIRNKFLQDQINFREQGVLIQVLFYVLAGNSSLAKSLREVSFLSGRGSGNFKCCKIFVIP